MPFIPEKLFLSVYDSLKHRANAVIESKHITQTVIDKITRINSASLNSKTIAETTLVALNRFDKAASTHYRAYHF